MDIQEFFKVKRSRQEIANFFDCSDREARSKIADLQEQYNIINLQDGKGYFIGSDKQVEEYAKQEMHRAKKTWEKARKMLQRVEQADGIKIPVKAHFRRLKAKDDKDDNQIEWDGL